MGKRLFNWKAMCILALLFAVLPLYHVSASAQEIVITINGVALETEVAPVIQSGRTLVPVRAVSEALGYGVGFDETANTVTMTQSSLGIHIQMTIGNVKAYVNGKPYTLDAAPVIIDGRTMVPVRFVGEAMDSRVIWQEAYPDGNDTEVADTVVIFTSHPVMLRSGAASISSTYAADSVPVGEENHVSYALDIPQFHGMKDKAFEASLNKEYREALDDSKKVMAELSVQEDGYTYTATNESAFRIVYDQKQMLSLQIEGYEYTGGVHGMPYRITKNIDFAKSKALLLEDLFQEGADYEGRIVQSINQLIASRQDIYEFVDTVDRLFYNESFYFEPGTLVMYFYPYDLSSYSRGFVIFRIPLAELADILLPEYAGL